MTVAGLDPSRRRVERGRHGTQSAQGRARAELLERSSEAYGIGLEDQLATSDARPRERGGLENGERIALLQVDGDAVDHRGDGERPFPFVLGRAGQLRPEDRIAAVAWPAREEPGRGAIFTERREIRVRCGEPEAPQRSNELGRRAALA